ncbi:MAG: efflux RND transporter permease subunit [Ilumatobacter sp.]|nr:efflux RND transporter permease subunit [Ilumatobacter sp.]
MAEAPDRADSEPHTSPHRRSVIAAISATAARRWQVTFALLAVVLVAGVSAFGFGLDREGFPPINTPISVVTGTYFVDDAAQVDADVVQPLDAAFGDVEGVVTTEAFAQPSSFTIVVEFESDIGSDVGTQRLIDLAQPVPDGVQILYNPVNAAKLVGRFDVLVSIVGPPGTAPQQLQEQAGLLSNHLEQNEHVAEADVRELVTESIDPATGEEEVRQTRFTRVALDSSGYEDAIAIGLVRSAGSDLDVLGFSDMIDEELAPERAGLDDGFAATITADFAVSVRQQLSSLTTNLLTGLVAVAIVSLLLIGWRVAAMTAGFMVIVMMGALIGLWVFGYSLNTITLFGLILTLGLLVDDAIVISESIDASRDDPDEIEETRSLGVVRTALERVGSASLAGTLTTVVVFSPMLFIGGILGEFIRSIPATVIITLLLSFTFSIVFIPAVARVFLLRAGPSRNPIVRGEKRLSQAAGRLAAYPWRNGWKGRLTGIGLVLVALVAIMTGGRIAGTLPFSIFPAGKDATGLLISAEFPPGTTIEQAQEISDGIDDVVVGVLGDELVRSQYVRGNERVIETFLDLSPIGSRSTTAPTFVERIEAGVEPIQGARITVGQLENGPPVLEFPFAMQIEVGGESTVAAGQELAEEVRDFLLGQQIGDATVIDAIVSTDGEIARVDGQRIIEVRAKYDEDQGLSGILNDTEALVQEAFPPVAVEARGLPADAVGFDFGLESDNQDDFAALGVAGMVALFLMLLLITIQFRSLAQSLLIFLAIPFSFFGVFGILSATDNPLSFLAVVGFIALIGVAVNNTILLIDSANRQRREGASAGEAIQYAITNRFRPLVATTLTTVVGLLPLSLSDPFWESLGFTLMGGLVSSTVLVLLAFPAFYLGLESVRTPLRNVVRRRQGRVELT